MFHRAIKLEFLEGVKLQITFQDGKVIIYDVSKLFDKYPGLRALENRKLFTSGKMTAYGVRWNDDLDLSTESVYENGEVVGVDEVSIKQKIGLTIKNARISSGISQDRLSELTGIDQGDISKIECGVYNPTVSTLDRIAKALGKKLETEIK